MSKRPPRLPACTDSPGRRCDTFARVVADYIKHHRGGDAAERRRFQRLPSLAAAVREAALSRRIDGKRHSHQRRIPGRSLSQAQRRLLRASLRRCKTFHELHRRVAEATARIPRIGPLTVYDVACRIGAFMRLQPNQVYLHCGALVGARRLGFRGRRTLQVHELPREFRRLSAGEAEDCLCIYQDELGAIMRRRGRSRQR